MSFDDLPENIIDPDVLDSGKFPLNRLVAFLGPYVAIGSGVVADWLLVHVHLLATFHVNHDRLASALAQVAVFAVVTLVTWAGHHKWLSGNQQWESLAMRLLIAQTNAQTGAPLNPSPPVGDLPVDAIDVPEVQAIEGGHPDGEYDPAEFGPTGGIGGKA